MDWSDFALLSPLGQNKNARTIHTKIWSWSGSSSELSTHINRGCCNKANVTGSYVDTMRSIIMESLNWCESRYQIFFDFHLKFTCFSHVLIPSRLSTLLATEIKFSICGSASLLTATAAEKNKISIWHSFAHIKWGGMWSLVNVFFEGFFFCFYLLFFTCKMFLIFIFLISCVSFKRRK